MIDHNDVEIIAMMTLMMTAMIFEQGDCASPDWRSCQEWCLAGSRITAIDVVKVISKFQIKSFKVVSKFAQSCLARRSIDALGVRA